MQQAGPSYLAVATRMHFQRFVVGMSRFNQVPFFHIIASSVQAMKILLS